MGISNYRFLQSVQRDARAAEAKKATLCAALTSVNAEIAALENDVGELEARGERESARAVREKIKNAEKRRRDHAEEIFKAEERVREILGRLGARIDPCDADPTVPLALLPVRLETRYTEDGAALRIRIFPDDIHVDQLDRGLSEDEIAAGKTYWTEAAADADAAAAAWTTLAATVHLDRAAWVAFALTPTNLEAWEQGAAPEFPKIEPRSRRAAVARLLPDRFVAIAEQSASRSTATGAVIAPEIVVGILADDGSQMVDVKGVKALPGGEWMFDYQLALEAGLAITLQLQQPGARINRLYVTGVRASLAPAESADTLEDLLHAHRFGRGLAFVPQGTPSNNTEKNRSAWQSRAEPTRLPSPTDPLPAPGSNAQILAAALGIDAAIFSGISHSTDSEQPLAQAMNTALWAPSWGTFLDRLAVPDGLDRSFVVPDEGREAARDFFRDSVRGRGPLPAIRVGNQPYGILPVSPLNENSWKKAANDRLQTGLLPILQRLRVLWAAAAEELPQLSGSQTADETFLDILGTTATAAGLRVRTVVSDDAARIVPLTRSVSPEEAELHKLIYAVAGLERSFRSLGSLESGPGHSLPFPMVDESDPGFIDALLNDRPRSVHSILQAMLEFSWEAAKKDLERAAPPSLFLETVQLATTLPSVQREQLITLSSRADTASPVELHALADAIAGVAEEEAGRTKLAKYAPLAAHPTSFAELATTTTLDTERAGLAVSGLGMWSRMLARQAEVREAMKSLLGTTTEERQILFGETLDLASHRLDAWLTAFVERRRVTLRAAKPSGLTIGAFGWVENLERGERGQSRGGYIHAPTLDHAKTAGVLRSAHLSHNTGPDPTGAFAINLSSARVRTALHLIDGMRQGQPLGAVLGYRFERRLHEEGLDRFILTLRGLAPLVGGNLSDRHDTVQPEAQETVAASNVLDGVRLLDRYNSSAAARSEIEEALRNPPLSNPFIQPADWPALTDAEWAKTQALIREMEADCDATADLLLAESVHQVIRGNTARASAALNAASSGDSSPPDPEIVRMPTQGVPFTHRLLLVAPGPGLSWNAARPRALAEPALEAWAAARLGPPDEIVVADELTLADTGLCALDVIYESADLRRLEQRVRAALPQLSIDTPLDPAFADMRELAAAWRAVLVSARPARPSDLNRPNDQTLHAVSVGALDAVKARAEEARGGLAARQQTLADALAPSGGVAPDPVQVAIALEELGAYGVVQPMIEGENFAALASVASVDALRRLHLADNALAGDFDLPAAEAVSQAIFGEGFWMIPAIDPPAQGNLFTSSLGVPPAVNPPRPEVRRFLRDIGSVRETVSRLSEALLISDALARPATLRVAQLCAEDAPWVGGAWDETQPTPREPVTNIVFDAPNEFEPAQPIVALTLDQWSDSVPLRAKFGEEEDAPITERRTTGLTLNAAAASACAPQAILLAVSPDGQRWTTDAVVAMLGETFALAKMRGVHYEKTFGVAGVLPALYSQNVSLQGEKSIDPRFLREHADLNVALAYVKEQP
jgi:hypothetical protein